MNSKPELSIIIPARNEERTITSVLRSLARQAHISQCEVIVVDGMSRDDTATVAGNFPFVRVVSCEPGRASQMNYGAERALGRALWFLHADSTIPDPYTIGILLSCLSDSQTVGGAFRFHLRGDDLYFRAVNMIVNLRTRLAKRAYGDQGIFVRADVFRTLGGFRENQLCEDLDLFLRMRQAGKLALLWPTVETSARTWQRCGKLPTTFWHLKQWVQFEWQRQMAKKPEAKRVGVDVSIALPIAGQAQPAAAAELPPTTPVEANVPVR